MHTIKKYANRKLYHTNRKQYITLDGISALVQHGEQVQVIDNDSGEDITAQILAQVALQARSSHSPLPVAVLTGIIQAGNDTISGLRRSVATAISGGDEVDVVIERRLDDLHSAGQLGDDEHARMLRLLIPRYAPTPQKSALPLVPSTNDIERLSAQIDALSAAVEQLLAEREQNK
ncbi:MAG: pesticidal protein Cry15Aa [Roseiflexaceae bacterium]|nr:pesticidal protein Cry15Aa [Roseiflexaceae bacterium]